jgi:bacterioferritin-associated ferredoxin
VFVCICNGITERQIREEIARGATSLPELTAALGIASGCGTCAEYARELLETSSSAPELRAA